MFLTPDFLFLGLKSPKHPLTLVTIPISEKKTCNRQFSRLFRMRFIAWGNLISNICFSQGGKLLWLQIPTGPWRFCSWNITLAEDVQAGKRQRRCFSEGQVICGWTAGRIRQFGRHEAWDKGMIGDRSFCCSNMCIKWASGKTKQKQRTVWWHHTLPIVTPLLSP